MGFNSPRPGCATVYVLFLLFDVMITNQESILLAYISIPRHIRKDVAMYQKHSRSEKHSMNTEQAKMKTCAVVCIVLIKIRRIIASKLCYSSWLPAISRKREIVGRKLCLKIILAFCIIVCCLEAT